MSTPSQETDSEGALASPLSPLHEDENNLQSVLATPPSSPVKDSPLTTFGVQAPQVQDLQNVAHLQQLRLQQYRLHMAQQQLQFQQLQQQHLRQHHLQQMHFAQVQHQQQLQLQLKHLQMQQFQMQQAQQFASTINPQPLLGFQCAPQSPVQTSLPCSELSAPVVPQVKPEVVSMSSLCDQQQQPVVNGNPCCHISPANQSQGWIEPFCVAPESELSLPLDAMQQQFARTQNVPRVGQLPQVQAQVEVQTVEEGKNLSLEFVQKKEGEPEQVIRINAENLITNPLKRSALSSVEGRRVRPKVMRPKVIPEKGQRQCQGKFIFLYVIHCGRLQQEKEGALWKRCFNGVHWPTTRLLCRAHPLGP